MTNFVDFERYLNIRSAYTPVWTSKDRRVAFLSDITGTPQVWAVDAGGGWPDQLTFFEDKVWSLDASPTGNRLICTRDVGGNERYQLFLISDDGSELRRLTPNDDAVHHFGSWSHDGQRIAYVSNARNGRDFDVYLQAIDGENPELVYRSEGNFRVLAWSPDDSTLILSHEVGSARQPLYAFDVESSRIRPLTGEEPVRNGQVHYTRDGGVYLITNKDREYMSPAHLDIAGGHIRYLTDHDREAESLAVSPEGESLAYTVNDNGYAALYTLDSHSGHSRHVADLPSGIVSEPVFSKDGRYIAVSVQGPRHNLNIWMVETSGLSCRQLTHGSLAGIPENTLIDPESIQYKTFDGRMIPAFYYRPPDVRPPLPVILYVHGGPESQIRPDFDPRFQYFLNSGYAILAPNVRGSAGYGKTYVGLDNVRRRMDAVADLKYAVDWLRESGQADPNRIDSFTKMGLFLSRYL